MDNYNDNKYNEDSYFSNQTLEEEKLQTGSTMENELRKTIQRQKKTMFRLMEKINRLRIACGVLVLLIALETFLWWGNSGNSKPGEVADIPDDTVVETLPENEDSGDTVIITEDADDERINEILSSMTLKEKIYQMIFTTPENLTGVAAVSVAGPSTKTALEKYPVGGLIYSSLNLETREQVQKMLSDIQPYNKVELFLAIDEEGGAASPLKSKEGISNVNVEAMSVIGASGDASKAQKAYSSIGSELKKLGFNLNFAPYTCIDTVNANTRSFGSDENLVASMVKEAVTATRKSGIASAVKYFPMNENSSKTVDDLKEKELVPFKTAVDSGADFVMISNKSDGKQPYFMSEALVNGILKGEFNFSGIAVAQSISDPSVTGSIIQEEAAVGAIVAGADMLVCTTGVSKTADAIEKAIESGKISSDRIDESVKRILRVKLNNGIIE